MKKTITYTVGSGGPWLDSVLVGVVAGIALLIVGTVMPVVCYFMAPACVVIGLLGLWRGK